MGGGGGEAHYGTEAFREPVEKISAVSFPVDRGSVWYIYIYMD